MKLADKVVDTLRRTDQPLTRIEIAKLGGINPNSLNSALETMVRRGQVHVRTEDKLERVLRVGTVNARPANLYAVTEVVPARTAPALVEGSMSHYAKGKSPAFTTSAYEAFVTEGKNENERRTKAGRVRDAVGNTFRSAVYLAGVAAVSETFARKVLDALINDGEVEAEKLPGKRGYRYRTVRVQTAPQAPVEVVPVVATPAPVEPVSDREENALTVLRGLIHDAQRVLELEDQVATVTEANCDLASENAHLKARVARLEQLVADFRLSAEQLGV